MFLILLIFWMILNGKFTVEIFLTGLVICAALTFAWHKVFKNEHNTVVPSMRTVVCSLRYCWNLVVEIVRCNIKVMYLVLHPSEEIHPKLYTFKLNLKKERHRVVLANSITLTPGTITVGLQDDVIRVHGLDASLLEGIEDCEMVRQLEKIEEGEPHND